MKRAKILHCIWSLHTGGAEEMLLDIMTRQAKTCDVHLMIINDDVDPKMVNKIPPQITVHRINRRRSGRSPWPIIKLNLLTFKLDPDAIHMHNRELPTVILPKMKRHKFMTVHDLGVEILGYHDLQGLVAISDAVRDDLKQRYGVDSHVIINGIATDAVKMRPIRPHGDTFEIVQVGRLYAEKKGQDILIRALRKLVDRGYDDLRVTLVGDGPDMDSLRSLAESEGVADKVTFAGMRDKSYIYEHLCDYDLMVHPSRWEGFGLTIAEAMAAQLPVAVPVGGGPYEVTDGGRLAVTFETDNVDACADAIAFAHDHYTSLLGRVPKAKAYAEQHFSIDRTVNQYLTLYGIT